MKQHDIAPDAFVEVWPGEGSPEISILMPVFQQARYLRDAVESVLAQRGVVAEIIISDDASSDGSFETARQAVQDWLSRHGSKHRIVMRRGSTRLWRDHLALLAEAALCDLVCQAHGDDQSLPDRARILVGVFRRQPNVTLLASEASLIDAEGRAVTEQRPVGATVSVSRIPFETVLRGHDFLIGFSQAWRRSALGGFARLDRAFAAVGHDRILPFRAALAGEVHLVNAQLIKRREHDLAAHNLMFDEPETQGRFGWGLAFLARLDAMKKDLARARETGRVDESLHARLTARIEQLVAENMRKLLDAHRDQTRANRQIAWVDDETLLQLRSGAFAAAPAAFSSRSGQRPARLAPPHVFIISWTGQHENSLRIAEKMQAHAGKLTLVYSDRDDARVVDAPCEAIRTPDDWYWGKKFKACLDACESDLMLVIHGDTDCADWPGLVRKCLDGFARFGHIGVWAPLVDYTPYDLGRTSMGKIEGTTLNIVAQTDGIVFTLSGPVIARLKALSYEENKYGWGIDWAMLAYSYANRLVAVVDDSVVVRHPRGRGYDSGIAQRQMGVFLRQLTADERIQQQLLKTYMQPRAPTSGRRVTARVDRPSPQKEMIEQGKSPALPGVPQD